MIKCLLKGILSTIAVRVLANYRHLSIHLFRVEAVKSYIHGVRLARLSAIGLMRAGLMIGLLCLGALLIHAGLFILLPWTVKAKAILGVCLGFAYIAYGGIILRAVTDEKTWMEKSGAAKMLDDVTGVKNQMTGEVKKTK